MREIKFRAWNGVMNYSVVVGRFGAFWVNSGKNNDGLDEKDKTSLTPFNTKCSENTIIMQFTGLKDKNGKEIYEGDIVAVFYSKDGIETNNVFSKNQVKNGKHNIGCNGYDFYIHGFYVEDEFLYGEILEGKCKVIGNIYENPELL